MSISKLTLLVSVFSIILFSGCSTVPLEPKGISDKFSAIWRKSKLH